MSDSVSLIEGLPVVRKSTDEEVVNYINSTTKIIRVMMSYDKGNL